MPSSLNKLEKRFSRERLQTSEPEAYKGPLMGSFEKDEHSYLLSQNFWVKTFLTGTFHLKNNRRGI